MYCRLVDSSEKKFLAVLAVVMVVVIWYGFSSNEPAPSTGPTADFSD